MSYLERFFAEKQLPERMFEVEGPEWGTNFIPSSVVIEHIMIAPAHEQAAIAAVIRKIDFANGDVNDFLEHLARSLAI